MKKEKRKNVLTFRVTNTEHKMINKLVKRSKNRSRSEFIRSYILSCIDQVTRIY